MKKIFIFYCLFIFSSIILYSQTIEKITYMDLGADGTQRINRTVNAVFAGWMQKQFKQEGNLQVLYQSICPVDGEWSDWVLESRRPMQGTLNENYNGLLRAYTLWTNAGGVLPMDGYTILQMQAIPTGKSTPFWWNTDGKSFFAFFRLYLVVN